MHRIKYLLLIILVLEDTRLKNETIRQLEEKLIGLKEQLK